MIELYTSDAYIAGFPGRVFEVVDVVGFSKAELKRVQALQKANIKFMPVDQRYITLFT